MAKIIRDYPGLFDEPEAPLPPAGLDLPPPSFRPRDYQDEMVSGVYAAWNDAARAVLGVAATGLGKSAVAGLVIRRWLTGEAAHFNSTPRALILAHREELITQMAAAASAACPTARVDIDQAQSIATVFRDGRVPAHIVVASVATLSQPHRLLRYPRDAFGMLAVDEAHHFVPTNQSYNHIYTYFKCPRMMGLTATPDRADKQALGQIFDRALPTAYSLSWGIENGWLIRPIVRCPIVQDYDLSRVSLSGGDLDGPGLSAVLRQEQVLHGIAGPIVDYANCRNRWYDGKPRQAIIFCSCVDHSRLMADILNRRHAAAGTGRAVHVDCRRVAADDRRAINAAFRSGEISYLCNYGVYGEGADFPNVRMVVLARKTTSRHLVEQMIGRGARPLPAIVPALNEATSAEERLAIIAASAKPSFLVIDPVANTGTHKLACPADVLAGVRSRPLAAVSVSAEPAQPATTDDRGAAALAAQLAQEQAEATRRAGLVIPVTYDNRSIDPFDLSDTAGDREPGWAKGRRPSAAMLQILINSGVENPEKLSYTEARVILDDVFARRSRNQCTRRQSSVLARYGLPDTLTFDSARRAIDLIAAHGWSPPQQILEQLCELPQCELP